MARLSLSSGSPAYPIRPVAPDEVNPLRVLHLTGSVLEAQLEHLLGDLMLLATQLVFGHVSKSCGFHLRFLSLLSIRSRPVLPFPAFDPLPRLPAISFA